MYFCRRNYFLHIGLDELECVAVKYEYFVEYIVRNRNERYTYDTI